MAQTISKQIIARRAIAALDRGNEWMVLYRKWDGSGDSRTALEFLDEYREQYLVYAYRAQWEKLGYTATRVWDLTELDRYDILD